MPLKESVPEVGVLGDLKRIAVSGVLWTGAGTVARQLIQIATSLVLARLLAPEIFGLLGMALVFVEIAQLFVDFGLGLAVIQARLASPLLLSSCFWLSSAIACAAAMVLSAAAPAIGTLYGEPRITALIPFLGINLLISGVLTVPAALVQRELRFAVLAKMAFAATLIGSSVAIGLAASGFGIWSLVAQPLVGTSAMCIFLFWVTRWRPRLEFSWHSLRGVVRFGSGIFGATLLNYTIRNGDNFLIGRLLGASQLGYYTLAYRLMLFPLGQVSNAIGKVTFPLLVGLQNDLSRYRDFYLRGCSAIAFVTFPMMCGLFVIADQFIIVLLGDQWLEAITVLKILCPVGLIQSIGTTVGNIFNSTGHTNTQFWWTAAAAPVILLAFALGLLWGIEGVAACYAMVTVPLTHISFRIAFRIVGLSMQSLGAALWRPLICALLMSVCVYLFDRLLLAGNVDGLLRLASAISFGIVCYLLPTVLVNQRDFKEFVTLTHSVVRIRAG